MHDSDELMREALVLVAIGSVAGFSLAYLAARSLGTVLHGIGPADPLAYGTGVALLLSVALVAAYLPAFRGGFIFDDNVFLTENPLIHAADGLSRFWFSREALDYWPVTSSTLWLEWRLWGDRPMGYHVLNVVLHAANAILIWAILQYLNIPYAWWVALVFAIHPVNVATAAWVSEQKNTQSMFFCALAVLSYLRFDRRSLQSQRRIEYE